MPALVIGYSSRMQDGNLTLSYKYLNYIYICVCVVHTVYLVRNKNVFDKRMDGIQRADVQNI